MTICKIEYLPAYAINRLAFTPEKRLIDLTLEECPVDRAMREAEKAVRQ